MVADNESSKLRVDIKTLLRYPLGTDKEILKIYLEYNDILVGKGIGSFNIWMKRANYLYAMEELEEAVVALDMALAHDADSSEAMFLKGVCLQLLALRESKDDFAGPLAELPHRLLREAKRCFETVVLRNPSDEEAHTYLTNLRCLLYSPYGGSTQSGATAPPAASFPDLPAQRPSDAELNARFGLIGDRRDDEPVGAVV